MRNIANYHSDVKIKPRCKCSKVCAYYSKIGGYSVQCKSCNAKDATRRRAAYKARKA